MNNKCTNCGGRKSRDEPMCEDCILARLAFLRHSTCDTDAKNIIRMSHKMCTPIRTRERLGLYGVLNTHRDVLDLIASLDIFYDNQNFNP